MRRTICLLLGVATGLVAFVVSGEFAKAAYAPAPGWASPAHMAPTGTLCFQHGNGTTLGPAITAAAAGWNATDLTVVAKASCTGYPRAAQVRFVAYYNSATNSRGYVTECAMYSPGPYVWTYLRGVWTWVASAPTVRVNYSPLAVKQCLNTTAKKTNMMSHETGHYLGLTHRDGATVMTSAQSSIYTIATYGDRVLINGRY